MFDNFGREITYARISVTDRCNLRCKYCMPPEGVPNKEHHNILRFEELLEIIEVLVSMGVYKIRITGGEPLVRRGIIDFLSKVSGINGVRQLAITTNAVMFGEYAEKLLSAGVTSVNISLDTLNADKYKDLTGYGDLGKALAGIEAAMSLGFKYVKINSVLMEGINDGELLKLAEFTVNNKVDVRFIELMPIGETAEFAKEHFLPASAVLEKIPELVEIDSDDAASPAKYYKLPGAMGRVGIIEPISCKFCQNCNRVRITADGKIKSCLHSDSEVDLKKFLGKTDEMKNVILSSVRAKQREHSLDKIGYPEGNKRNMNRIGG